MPPASAGGGPSRGWMQVLGTLPLRMEAPEGGQSEIHPGENVREAPGELAAELEPATVGEHGEIGVEGVASRCPGEAPEVPAGRSPPRRAAPGEVAAAQPEGEAAQGIAQEVAGSGRRGHAGRRSCRLASPPRGGREHGDGSAERPGQRRSGCGSGCSPPDGDADRGCDSGFSARGRCRRRRECPCRRSPGVWRARSGCAWPAPKPPLGGDRHRRRHR